MMENKSDLLLLQSFKLCAMMQNKNKRHDDKEIFMKTAKKVWNIFSTICVSVVVLMAVLFVGVRLFGLTPYCVLSGSMEPQYPVGSLIYVKNAEPSDIKVGDAITFVLNENSVVATHQVYAIDWENEFFYTQGIANVDSEGNIEPDANPVYFGNLIGVPVFTVPALGYIAHYVTTAPGVYIFIGLIILLLLSLFMKNPFKRHAAL